MNLSSTIKSIQDIMRKDDGVDGDAQRFSQLTWMLFLKVFDQPSEMSMPSMSFIASTARRRLRL